MFNDDAIEEKVHGFWNAAACGEELYLQTTDQAGYMAQMDARYALEPFIKPFAQAERTNSRDVLGSGIDPIAVGSKAIVPRRLLRAALPSAGLFMLIEAKK